MSEIKHTKTCVISNQLFNEITSQFDDSKKTVIDLTNGKESMSITKKDDKYYLDDGRNLISVETFYSLMYGEVLLPGEIDKFGKFIYETHLGCKIQLRCGKKKLLGVNCLSCGVREGQ